MLHAMKPGILGNDRVPVTWNSVSLIMGSYPREGAKHENKPVKSCLAETFTQLL